MQDGRAFVKNILITLKSAHIDKIICFSFSLSTKDIPSIMLDKKMCTRYQLLERIDSVTPLYRGLYTTVSKKAINTV